MPKPKNSPHLPGLPTVVNLQDDRAARGKLAEGLSFVSDKGVRLGLSIERAEALAMKRADQLTTLLGKRRELRARAAEAMRDGIVRRRYLAAQRAADRAIAAFWRRFFAKRRPIEKKRAAPSRKMARLATPGGSTRLPSYSGPVIDRLGRQGVFLSVRYYGAKRAKVGVARRLVRYITRKDALERDCSGNVTMLSNVGEDVAEQEAAFDLVETLARASRGNAKVVFSLIVNLPHDVSPEGRREILQRFCLEAFAIHDLPYVATIHAPPAEGDQRNTHAHVAFALRPMRRIGDHEWDVAPRLATEFDGEARFTYLRQLFAETMTNVCRAHGKNRIYTHLSNAARGLRATPLMPLGPALTKAVRDGQVVGVNERNRVRISSNEEIIREDHDGGRNEQKAGRTVLDRHLRDMIVSRRTPLPAIHISDRAPAPLLTVPAPSLGNVVAPSLSSPPHVGQVLRPVSTRNPLPTLTSPSPTVGTHFVVPLPGLHTAIGMPIAPALPPWSGIDAGRAIVGPARLPKAITTADNRVGADAFAILERLRWLDEATERTGQARKRRTATAAMHRDGDGRGN